MNDIILTPFQASVLVMVESMLKNTGYFEDTWVFQKFVIEYMLDNGITSGNDAEPLAKKIYNDLLNIEITQNRVRAPRNAPIVRTRVNTDTDGSRTNVTNTTSGTSTNNNGGGVSSGSGGSSGTTTNNNGGGLSGPSSGISGIN